MGKRGATVEVERGTTERAQEKTNVQVHLNVPTIVWRAVAGIAEATGTSMTNVVVRALNREAYFWRVKHEEPDARIWIEYPDGTRQEVVFL